LFTAQDTITVDGQPITGKRSVTVGKSVMAVLILVVGYWVSGLIAWVVEPIIVKRLKIEPNHAGRPLQVEVVATSDLRHGPNQTCSEAGG
jgi:hypothetical protein